MIICLFIIINAQVQQSSPRRIKRKTHALNQQNFQRRLTLPTRRKVLKRRRYRTNATKIQTNPIKRYCTESKRKDKIH